jgi:Phage P22-like portal protein
MPELPRQTDEEADTDQAVWLECAERFRIAEAVESPNRALAIEDLEFADGQQWPDDLYNQRKISRRPSLTINMTGMLVRRVVNNLREQRPRIKVHPVSDADVEDASIVAGLIRHIENISNADVAYDAGVEPAVRMGWGYWRIVGEYRDEKSFEQELLLKPIRNPLTCYIDPSSTMPDGSDMEWFIISTEMKRKDFKRKYPDEPLNAWLKGAAGDSETRWENKESLRLAEYYRIRKVKDTLIRLTDAHGTERDIFGSEYRRDRTAFDLAGFTVAKDAFGEEVRRPTHRRQVQWFRLTGRRVAEKRNLPGRWIPVVRVEGNVCDVNGDVRRKGMVRDLKDPARMINYWETAKTEKLALTSKAPWIVAEGQIDGHPEWEDANQKPYSTLQYKILTDMQGQPLNIPPPQRQPPVDVEAGFTEAAQESAKALLFVAGMPHEPNQDQPGTVVSGVALRRRQALSDISHFQFFDNLTLSIAHTGRIILDNIPHYYGEKRIQRIVQEDGTPEMVTLNEPGTDESGAAKIAHNMKVGRYEVVMDTGPGYESKREEMAQAMVDLLKTPLAEPLIKSSADLIVRNFDFPGADTMADRLAPATPQGLEQAMKTLPKQAQAIVTALSQQLAQANQALQNAHLELKYKGSIEQGWMAVEREKTRTQADVKANDAAVRAHTALDVAHTGAQATLGAAEIHETGALLQRHVEGKHAQAARKDELQAAERAEGKNGA